MNMRARDLDMHGLWLAQGPHRPASEQMIGGRVRRNPEMCLMEATAYIAGEPWSDRPRCVSPLLVGFGRIVNDLMTNPMERQRLKPYARRIIGTGAGIGPLVSEQIAARVAREDRERAYICARVAFRRFLPEFMERHDAADLAVIVREAGPVVDAESAAALRDRLQLLRVKAWARSHFTGAAVDRGKILACELVMEGVTGDIASRNIGGMTAELYGATHADTSWDEALELFDELCQVKHGS